MMSIFRKRRKRSESKIGDEFVGKEVILTPKTTHAKNRCREYGYIFTVTKVIKGLNTRYQVTSLDNNYQRWISLDWDKHFDFKLYQV